MLRSAEVKPLFYRFVQHLLDFSLLTVYTLEGRHFWSLEHAHTQGAESFGMGFLRAGSFMHFTLGLNVLEGRHFSPRCAPGLRTLEGRHFSLKCTLGLSALEGRHFSVRFSVLEGRHFQCS